MRIISRTISGIVIGLAINIKARLIQKTVSSVTDPSIGADENGAKQMPEKGVDTRRIAPAMSQSRPSPGGPEILSQGANRLHMDAAMTLHHAKQNQVNGAGPLTTEKIPLS